MIIAVFERNLSNCEHKPEKVRTSTGFEPVTSPYRCDALTNWVMKPLTLGAGHLWILMSPWRMDVKWYMKCIELRIWNQVSHDQIKSAVQYMKHFIYHFTSILHGLIRTHKLLTFQASVRNCLNCVQKLRWSRLTWFQIRSSIYETFHISLHIGQVSTNYWQSIGAVAVKYQWTKSYISWHTSQSIYHRLSNDYLPSLEGYINQYSRQYITWYYLQ